MTSTPPEITIYKMQGSGNDFVLIDNTEPGIHQSQMPNWARCICRRSFGAGADGLIFLEPAAGREQVDYRWHFYNADGSRAEMCGNGSRCAARLAYMLGLAPADHVLGTDAGPVRAIVDTKSREVQVQLTTPRDYTPDIALTTQDGRGLHVHLVNTGVPHVVLFSDQADQEDIDQIGPALRYHQRFAPAGANANIVQLTGDDSLYVRTYERGVEAETYACGTGAAASAFVANALGLCRTPVRVVTSGGEELNVDISGENIYLQGQAVLVYTAQLNLPAVGLASE
ncbi:diaminopimelate epimerase [Desulfovermiculus halophilus]|jgi:diaminopimelate epimerase|uniref:diaminopimelate epimerase n=1 Tax=Desulfovermiculus halophilus TaxID=339722 RepID=UPI0004836D3D|nr:diaminopimelate epimerase [Desulfovermiculus halophilus]